MEAPCLRSDHVGKPMWSRHRIGDCCSFWCTHIAYRFHQSAAIALRKQHSARRLQVSPYAPAARAMQSLTAPAARCMRLQAAPRRRDAAAAPATARRQWRQARLQVRRWALSLSEMESMSGYRQTAVGARRSDVSSLLHCSLPLPPPSRQPSPSRSQASSPAAAPPAAGSGRRGPSPCRWGCPPRVRCSWRRAC